RSAATRALHVGIVKFEAGCLQSLHIIDDASLEVHQRGGINEHLKLMETKNLIHDAGGIFEVHGIAETRAASTHNSDPQTGSHRVLLRHDLFHLSHGRRCKTHWKTGRSLNIGLYGSCHSLLLDETSVYQPLSSD